METSLSRILITGIIMVSVSNSAFGKTDVCVNEGQSVFVSNAGADTSSNYKRTWTQNSYEKVEVISRGKLIDLIEYLAPGKYTAFLFYADWCGPCKILKPKLEEFAKSSNKFALREINIINWENPLVRYYDLHSIPFFIIYGPNGKFIERGPGITNETMRAISSPD